MGSSAEQARGSIRQSRDDPGKFGFNLHRTNITSLNAQFQSGKDTTTCEGGSERAKVGIKVVTAEKPLNPLF